MKKLVYIQISIATIFIVSLLSSCSTEKRCQRRNAKSERLGCLTHDTMYLPGEVKKGEKELFLDSAKLDSIAQVIAEEYQRLLDSCSNGKDSNNARISQNLVKTRKEEIKKSIKQIPCKIEPISDSTARFTLKIWVDSGKLKYNVEIKDLEVPIKFPKCPEPKWYEKWWFGFVCGIGLMFGILYLVNRKNYVK